MDMPPTTIHLDRPVYIQSFGNGVWRADYIVSLRRRAYLSAICLPALFEQWMFSFLDTRQTPDTSLEDYLLLYILLLVHYSYGYKNTKQQLSTRARWCTQLLVLEYPLSIVPPLLDISQEALSYLVLDPASTGFHGTGGRNLRNAA
jgi:hypothetical protein